MFLLSVFFVCQASTCGSPATDPSTLRIRNHGVEFATSVATKRTYAWNEGDLGDVAAISGAVDQSTLLLHGSYPRELYVFDRPSVLETSPGIAPWQPPEPTHWLSLPGSAYGKTGDATLDVPMAVLMARLVDHGECSRFVPFKDSQGQPGFFHELNDSFYAYMKEVIQEIDGTLTPNQMFASYQATILKGTSDFADGNEDGFALRVSFNIDKWKENVHVDTLYIVAVYRILSDDGFFRVAAVGDIEVLGPEQPKVIADMRNVLPSELFARARNQYGVKLEAQDGRSVSCTPSSPTANASCATPGKIALASAIAAGAGGLAAANQLTSELHDSSFFCQAKADAPGHGVCTYMPYFKRFNVLPDGLEAVWYDQGDPPSADWKVYLASKVQPPVVVGVTGECAADRLNATGGSPNPLGTWGFGSL